MNHIPEFILENSSWYIHYSDLFAIDRIKANNRNGGGGGAPPTAPKKMLKGASLMAAMKNL
jgi:hypothetical protein